MQEGTITTIRQLDYVIYRPAGNYCSKTLKSKLINLNYDDKTSDLGLVPENVMAWHAFMLYVLPIHNAVALGKIILG